MVDAGNENATKLLIYVTGLVPPKSDALLQKMANAQPGQWLVHQHDHRLKPWGRQKKLEAAVDTLSADIATRVRVQENKTGTAVEEVRLVGHSIGGLLARAAYLKSGGWWQAVSGDNVPWAPKVRRIVLLGSPNAGYRREAMKLHLRVLLFLLGPFAKFTAEATEYQGYWITNLRLRWLNAFDAMGASAPLTVNVIGGKDGLVTADDTQDVAFMPRMVDLTTGGADHAGLVNIDQSLDPEGLWIDLQKAIFDEDYFTPEDANPRSKEPVYFIEHGIRTDAHDAWVKPIKDAIGGSPAVVIAPSYGFFSAWEFALPLNRHRNVHTFINAYAEKARTHHPNNFRFFGHSNGTFMMGRSLLEVSAVKFERIMLAGTVLPPKFRWTDLVENGQIGHYTPSGDWQAGIVHNDRARIDWPVGGLCAFLNGLWPFQQDIGPGGTRGFNNAAIVTEHSLFWPGGHGGALTTQRGYADRPTEIAKFLRGGADTCKPTKKSPWIFRAFSRLLQVGAWLIVAAIVYWLYVLFGDAAEAWGLATAAAVYAAGAILIYLILRII